jgi:DNA-binding transcriptional regulator YdaS (Cro superfamily)
MDLRTFLKTHKLTAPQFADRVGVSVWAVNKWVARVRTPRPEQIDRITAATDGKVTANDLQRQRAA